MSVLRLFLLFTLVPIIELALLIEVGQHIGTWPTVFIVLGTGALGAYVARAQGFATLRRIREQLHRGEIPAEGLVDGVLILAGGILLISPGLISDVAGIALVLPASRTLLKRWLRRRIESWIGSANFRFYVR